MTTTIDETEVEPATITTQLGSQRPAVLHACLEVLKDEQPKRYETVTLFHDGGGCECDSWLGVSQIAGAVCLCLDIEGWQFTGDKLCHVTRFTSASDELPLLMGVNLLNSDERPYPMLLVEIVC